jgi:hypothetical protein
MSPEENYKNEDCDDGLCTQAVEDALLLARADINALRAQLTVVQKRVEAFSSQLGRLSLERERMAAMSFWQRLLWAFKGFPVSSTPPEVLEARRARRKRQALKKKASRAAGSAQEGP